MERYQARDTYGGTRVVENYALPVGHSSNSAHDASASWRVSSRYVVMLHAQSIGSALIMVEVRERQRAQQSCSHLALKIALVSNKAVSTKPQTNRETGAPERQCMQTVGLTGRMKLIVLRLRPKACPCRFQGRGKSGQGPVGGHCRRRRPCGRWRGQCTRWAVGEPAAAAAPGQVPDRGAFDAGAHS
jgi:hypothetical protein